MRKLKQWLLANTFTCFKISNNDDLLDLPKNNGNIMEKLGTVNMCKPLMDRFGNCTGKIVSTPQ